MSIINHTKLIVIFNLMTHTNEKKKIKLPQQNEEIIKKFLKKFKYASDMNRNDLKSSLLSQLEKKDAERENAMDELIEEVLSAINS